MFNAARAPTTMPTMAPVERPPPDAGWTCDEAETGNEGEARDEEEVLGDEECGVVAGCEGFFDLDGSTTWLFSIFNPSPASQHVALFAPQQ
jgi:hypothetical protein